MGRPELFLNREGELSFLTQFFSTDIGKSRACVLTAPSGVGKSRLTQQASRRVGASASIRVVPTRHRGIGNESFYYVELLANETNHVLSKVDGARSMARFRAQRENKSLFDSMAADAKDMARRLYVPVETLSHFKRRAAATMPSIVAVAKEPEKDGPSLKVDYLHYALDAGGYLFVLENVQDIDLRSYQALLSLLERRWPHGWLFEYTSNQGTNGSGGISLDDMIADLRERCDVVDRYPLERLPPKEVADLVAANDTILAYVLDRYQQSDGNLRPFVDLAYGGKAVRHRLEGRSPRGTQAPLAAITTSNIKGLSEPDRIVLYLVHVLGRLAERTALREIIDVSLGELVDLDESLGRLFDRRLIEERDDKLVLSHDRIFSAVEEIGKKDRLFTVVKTSARRFLEQTLQSGPSGRTGDADVLGTLCVLYNDLGEGSRISRVLEQVARLVAETGRTDRLVELLRAVEERLEERGKLPKEFKTDAFRQLCMIYYSAGYPADALRACLELPHCVHRALVQAVLTDLTYRHDEALELLNNVVLPYIDEGQDIYIAARVTEISIKRSLNDHAACERELRLLLENERLEQQPDFPLVQRAAEMVLPIRQAEPLVELAAMGLFRQGRAAEAARTWIIAVFMKSQVGKFGEADACAELARDLLTETFNERQCWLNNLAASRLLRGAFDEETIQLCRRARLTAIPGYDQIVILNNLLICHAATGDQDHAVSAATYLEKVLGTTAVKEKDILRTLYFNLSQFWKGRDESRHAAVLQKSKDNHCDYDRDDWERIWRSEDWSNPDYRGPGALRFIPTFLSYWTVDLSALLQHVQ
jgi:AAA ATPase domain